MRSEIRDAIEAARDPLESSPAYRSAMPVRRMSFGAIRAILYAVVRELPEDMMIGDLRDELEISNNQHERD